MNNVISKELLSEVLGCDCVACYFEDTYNLINYKYEYDVTWSEKTQYDNSSINIHELAHKCKEWASEEGYTLLEFGKCVYLIPDDFDDDELCFGDYNCFSEKTEPETIFKACQWILNNKEQIC